VIKQQKAFDLRVLQHATEDPARKLRCSRIWKAEQQTDKIQIEGLARYAAQILAADFDVYG